MVVYSEDEVKLHFYSSLYLPDGHSSKKSPHGGPQCPFGWCGEDKDPVASAGNDELLVAV
jgi:hypothetical protein